jgi:hypothetical protein
MVIFLSLNAAHMTTIDDDYPMTIFFRTKISIVKETDT